MKVEHIAIDNFRSIHSCSLSACQDFNVLIGKNNSGKSNVLFAIHAFFQALRHGDIICLESPIGKDVDFHQKNVDTPAGIALTFQMSDDELTSLIDGIVNDFPQMANAVGNFEPNLRLRVRVEFEHRPQPYACIKKLSLLPHDNQSAIGDDRETILLEVDRKAALELYETHSQYQRDNEILQAIGEFLRRMERDDWPELQRVAGEGVGRLRRPRPLRLRAGSNPEADRIIESLSLESASYEEFREALQAEVDRFTMRAQRVDKHRLDQDVVTTFSGTESSIPEHVHSLLRHLADLTVLNVTDDRRPIGRTEAERLLNLKMQRGGQEKLTRIQDIVFALLGVQIDAFAGEPSSRGRDLSAELDVDDFVVEVNGSGIKEALRLVLDIEFEGAALLLIEEPEIHLHPALETAMMRYLRAVGRDRQVFVTTHSTNFLDNATRGSVYLVSKHDSTKTELLDQTGMIERVPEELGIRLSSLFIYDRLLFVESRTDEEVIRAWAKTLGMNLNQANVGFVYTSGSRNLAYFAAESTLEFLAARRMKLWFVLDRDEKDEDDIAQIRQHLGPRAGVFVLDKREIENYLCSPRAMCILIGQKLAMAGNGERGAPEPEEMMAIVDEEVEKLRSVAVAKRVTKLLCKPIYPSGGEAFESADGRSVESKVREEIDRLEEGISSRRDAVVEQIDRITEEVEDQWLRRRLDIVPGDLLIDLVFRRFGVRFWKRKGDSARLAEFMEAEDIAPEIASFIREVCG
ncbi:MAG: AAA family ATPase [Chloroflexi bacterium]|nr:AAA family ATPase [Chloroflexota bacterium]